MTAFTDSHLLYPNNVHGLQTDIMQTIYCLPVLYQLCHITNHNLNMYRFNKSDIGIEHSLTKICVLLNIRLIISLTRDTCTLLNYKVNNLRNCIKYCI